METLTELLATFPARKDSPAIIFRTGVRRFSYSYEKLYDYALRMASLLRTHGISPGDSVVVWAPNSPWWCAAFWGCVACGAVVVPVDFMSDRERARMIAERSDARLVLQSRFKAERIVDLPNILIEDLEFALPHEERLQTLHEPAPEDTAELIFTSGTTGSPKGVILSHRNLMGNLRQVDEHIPVVTADFRFLSLLPLSHMFEQMGGFFIAFRHGASIVYMATLKPSAILESLREEDVQVTVLVPRLLQMLGSSVERRYESVGLGKVFARFLKWGGKLPFGLRKMLFFPVHRTIGRHFRFFVSGGAALDPEVERFWDVMGFRVIEGYGLTECSPVLTAGVLDRPVPGTVGKPLPGVDILIRDGEILARGANVFRGYFRNDDATRGAFTEDGWFRTGDMGELTPDGLLRIRGRKKDVIVTGAGVNVYPDDIEPVLQECAGVREACVVGKSGGEGESVHAVLVLDGSDRRPDDIVKEANARLDSLQRITGWTVWSEAELPKTTTLKVRKHIVKEVVEQGRGGEASVSQDALFAIVCRATGASPHEVRDASTLVDDLGLTSIGRLELVNLLEQEYRVDLEDSMIGPLTTVKDLRDLISRRERVQVSGHFRLWTNSPPVRLLRRIFDALINYPVFRLLVTLKVQGIENLQGVAEPVFFISNHVSYLDQPAIMFALPRGIRYRTATAAWAEFFFKNFHNLPQKIWKRFAYEYGSLALNLFPIPQSSGFRPSLRFMGRLADRGVNILLFPEGERTLTGELLPFRPGLGLMLAELRMPLVPVRISGLEEVLPRGAVMPRRGTVTVTFGKPLIFHQEAPATIVASAQQAVQSLPLQ